MKERKEEEGKGIKKEGRRERINVGRRWKEAERRRMKKGIRGRKMKKERRGRKRNR